MRVTIAIDNRRHNSPTALFPCSLTVSGKLNTQKISGFEFG